MKGSNELVITQEQMLVIVNEWLRFKLNETVATHIAAVRYETMFSITLEEKVEANARLIAKAPEMYELLKEYWRHPPGASRVIKRDDAAKALLKEIDDGVGG